MNTLCEVLNLNNQILLFLQETIRLKRMLRSGWVYSGVSLADVESVADHSYMITLLTLIIVLDEKSKGNEIDLEKVLIMSLIHDLSECNSQDLDRRIRKFSVKKYDEFKKELDKNAIKSLLDNLPQNLASKIMAYYEEFIKHESIESKIVVEADRLETILQLNDYIQRGFPQKLFKEFFENFNQEKSKFQFDLVRNLASTILEEYDEHDKN